MGVEPAIDAATTAKEKGFNVFHGYLHDAAYADNFFDIIILFELIEHIQNPSNLLKECHRILKPGGILLLNTPNAASFTARFMKGRWEGFDLYKMGGHISFFTPATLKLLARRCDFKIIKTETRNIRFYEKGQCSYSLYKTAKILGQLLAYPIKLIHQGHDLLCFLSKD